MLRLIAFLTLMLLPTAALAQSQQVIMGWVESVQIDSLGLEMKAKLDTGAKTSSMRADIVKIVEPDDEEGKKKKRRVIFKVEGTDGKTLTLERTLVRWVRIKSRSGGEFHRRPVVEMDYCIAGRRVHSEVNLAPREDFLYPILIGRNMLKEAKILVDSSKTFTAQPICLTPEPKDD